MKALEILNFSSCSGLKKFPNIQGNMENLLELYLASTAIEELPSSIGHLTGLVLLDLKWCKNLKSLPTSICKLKSLENLSLSGCSKLESFPEVTENMDNLKELLLDGTPIEVLPSSIERLKGLILLNLRKCKNLEPRSLQCLAQLHADGTAIAQPPDSIVLLRNLQVLIYPGCKILAPNSLGSLFSFWLLHGNSSNGIGLRLPSSFSSFRSLSNLDISDCKLIEGAIPNVPESHRNSGASTSVRDIDAHNCTALLPGSSSVSTLQGLQFLFYNCSKPVEDQSSDDKRTELQIFPHIYVSSTASDSSVTTSPLPTDWYSDDFLGFALCSVLEHLPERIICHLNSDVFDYGDLKDFGHDFHWTGNIVGSEHVWLEDLEGIRPQNRKQLKSSGCNVVERSSDRAGLNRSGMESSSSAADMDPPMIHAQAQAQTSSRMTTIIQRPESEFPWREIIFLLSAEQLLRKCSQF
ncbi:TMV resistance protein N [Vitis vinifera]|uniref:TMV resistance protein N n=1 Tax=Vitis vinifera TaxID=29760 RepID=A0A438GEI8_VITVI|nr:TMV resistance protein N [Vitis vinifera]